MGKSDVSRCSMVQSPNRFLLASLMRIIAPDRGLHPIHDGRTNHGSWLAPSCCEKSLWLVIELTGLRDPSSLVPQSFPRSLIVCSAVFAACCALPSSVSERCVGML